MSFLFRALVALCPVLATATTFAQACDTLLLNGKIVTTDEHNTIYQALAVREGGIVALG